MTFEIDAETQAALRLGAGPIVTASRLAVTSRLDAAGGIAVDLPASDPQAALFPDNVSRYVRGRAYDSSWATVGRGVIKSRTLSSDSMTLRLSGPDLADELTRTHVGTLQLHDGAGNPMPKANVLAAILAYALPTGWSATGMPSKDVYYEFGDETVLAALIKIVEYTGDHFRIVGREIQWLPTTSSGFVPVASGLRAVDTGDGDDLVDNPEICLIEGDLEEVADDTPRITRIYPRGSGNAGARLYLNATTRAAPAGYTLHLDADPAQSYIAYDAAEAADGIISHVESLRDISVLGNATTSDQVAAANALFDAALPFLQKRLTTQKSYRLRLTKVSQSILPGTSIRVVCKHVVAAYRWINVDADFLILEVTETHEADATAPRYALQISTVDRWPNDDSAPIEVTRGDMRTLTTAIRAQKVNATHVQPAVRALLSAGITGGVAGRVAFYSSATAMTTHANSIYWDAVNGRLGIGTEAPAAKVHQVVDAGAGGSQHIIAATITGQPTGTNNVMTRTVEVNPPAAMDTGSNVTVAASRIVGQTPSGSTLNFSKLVLRGMNGVAQHNGSGPLNTLLAMLASVVNNSTGTVTNSHGFRSTLNNSSGGTVSNHIAFLASQPTGASGSTLSNPIGLNIESMRPTAGSFSGTSYGVKQDGALDLNLFAGVSTFSAKATFNGGTAGLSRILGKWVSSGTPPIGDHYGNETVVLDVDCTIQSIIGYAVTAPSGGAATIDIEYKRGGGAWTSLYSTLPTFASGANSPSAGTLSTTALNAGDLLRLNWDAVNGIAGVTLALKMVTR